MPAEPDRKFTKLPGGNEGEVVSKPPLLISEAASVFTQPNVYQIKGSCVSMSAQIETTSTDLLAGHKFDTKSLGTERMIFSYRKLKKA
jgi:hypothetical protein